MLFVVCDVCCLWWFVVCVVVGCVLIVVLVRGLLVARCSLVAVVCCSLCGVVVWFCWLFVGCRALMVVSRCSLWLLVVRWLLFVVH